MASVANAFYPVFVSKLYKNGELVPRWDHPVTIHIEYDPQGINIKMTKGDSCKPLTEFPLDRFTESSRVGKDGYIISIDTDATFLRFKDDCDQRKFHTIVNEVKFGNRSSVFSERTEDSSAIQYFQFYGYLSQQQNMLQDYVRTSTYQKAVLANTDDFRDKVVLDVGAGSGILSFFAVQAGARRVYAVEASSMAQHAETLVAANGLRDKICVIAGKIEEIELPEKVDVIISEPMGYMLYNERMLETYLHSKKWLNPNGIMFPSKGDLHVAPFMDDALYMEQTSKASFWVQTCFHGVDLSSMRDAATKEYFRQPIVDTFDMRICLAKSIRHSVDFMQATETDLHRIEIPLEFYILESGTVHGLAFWFDVAFTGSSQTVWLSTSPTEALTHWYQVRCLLESPLFVKSGQLVTGNVTLEANQRQSYDVTIDVAIEGVENSRSTNTLDLKNPYFRYSGQPVVPPPGTNTTSPSEAYWSQLDAQGARQAVSMVNGISVNGLGEVSLEVTGNQTSQNIIGLATQPNIHPGSITSTGRQRASFSQSSQGPGSGLAAAGVITPTMFSPVTANQLMLANNSHFPVNNSLMIGDYVAPANNVLSVHGFRQ